MYVEYASYELNTEASYSSSSTQGIRECLIHGTHNYAAVFVVTLSTSSAITRLRVATVSFAILYI
jgi:hypothetical protein